MPTATSPLQNSGSSDSPVWRQLLPAIAIFLILATLAAVTKLPSSEEGSFSDPARNLLRHGSFGTTVIEAKGIWIEGIDRYTYWIMPLHPLLQSAWYLVWGDSLFSLRALSILFGLGGLASWYLILRRTTGDADMARLGALLLAVNYVYINSATYGRMDMMAAALNFAALAAYLVLRERSLERAFLISHTLAAAAGMTHFLGLCGWVAVLMATAWMDGLRPGSWRRALRLWGLAAIPYLAAGAAWSLYITRDFPLFRRQFGGNATAGGRMEALANPLSGLLRELTGRFATGYGLGTQSSGHASAAVMLKATVLVVYALALVCYLVWPRLQRQPGVGMLLAITGAIFALMSVIDGQKLTIYLVHIVPYLSALTAIWLVLLWRWRTVPRAVLAGVVLALMAVDAGGVLLRARLRLYQQDYLPVTAMLRERAAPSDLIVGRANLYFGLGPAYRLKDDIRLGFYSGSRPEWIVVEEEYRQAFELYRKNEPEIGAFIDRRLGEEYQPVFSSQSFQLYRRK
jgi:4-amino-4-deoxy-L-arabinose transferase-like glycosyltransferase